MHQDPVTGVFIFDLEDCVSPGPNGFPETPGEHIQVEDWPGVDGPAGHDGDTAEFPTVPVPPPAAPARLNPIALTVMAGVLTAEMLWPGTFGLLLLIVGAVAGFHLFRRHRDAGQPPPEGTPHMFGFRSDRVRSTNGVREYELRMFDGSFRVLRNEFYTITIDLSGPEAEERLMQRLTRMATLARQLENHPMTRPMMGVYDVHTGQKIKTVAGF